MADLDTSALRAVLPGISDSSVKSPFEFANQMSQAQKNALDVQEKQAQKAVGNILQQATDANGNVNYETAQRLAAQAGPVVQMGMQNMLKDTSVLRGQQLTQGVTRNTAINNAIIGALDGDDAGLHDRVVAGFQGLVSSGAITQEEATRSALRLPTDTAQLRQRLQQAQISLAPADLQQKLISGQVGTQTGPGGVTQGNVTNLRTGQVSVPPQTGAPQGLSPEAAAERQRWLQSPRDYPDPKDPNTTKHGTNETFLKDSGVPDQYVYTGGAPATPGSQPATPSPLGTGRLPPALQNKPQTTPATPAPVAPVAPAPASSPFGAGAFGGGSSVTPAPAPTTPPVVTPPSPAGTGISGPTPAQKAAAAAIEKQGDIGPAKFQAEADADVLAQNQQAILANMLVDTSQFTTGPLAGIVGKVRNVAGNFGLNINAEAQSAKESFGKLAAGIAVSQAQAVGAGSDTRFNVVSAANPHEELSPAGVDMILRQLQGNADYIRARASLAAKHSDKSNYPAFQESIKELDPRVFQLARMTDPQRTTYWNNVTDKAQLGAAIKKAKDMGVLGG